MVAQGLRPITRVLIANRGEIAVRIASTCRRLGIETVAVYSDADRRALHVLECDQAVHIGGSAPTASYLNIARIIEVAQETGADALHPGYGLLSENPALAEACDAAGIIFIGPSAEAIRVMGDKAHARSLAIEHGVSVIPGYQGENQDVAYLQKQAEKIGFPVMIKAVAGGGGRGMRLVDKPDAFERSAEAARRESERAFGTGGLVLERAITEGRHVEIQVMADSHGNIVHLGERDCSVQRRHQKVVEESPSPAVNAKLRAKMGGSAVQLAKAVGYVNAGTVEFMLDADGSFYFLEMNTRLQVEHGVTELRTSTDIVALQLAIASGEKLPFTQDEVTFGGHAIECRVYAEDPLKNYTPSPGPVKVLRAPSGPYVRNDIGTYEGDEISTYYDPMISKLLTWGANRLEAIERMEEALSQYRVEGVKTNLSLLRAVITHPEFRAGNVTTQFLDKHIAADAMAGTATEEVLLAAFGYAVLAGAHPDPWRAAGPIRSGGTAHLDIEYGGRVQIIEGQREAGTRDRWIVSAVHREHRIRYSLAAGNHVLVEFDDHAISARVVGRPGGVEVTIGDRVYPLSWAAGEQQRGVTDTPRAAALTAPMPGLVLKVLVRPGQKVKAHQTLVVLEAMKMEHAIDAPHDGVVKAVHCKEGGRVAEGAVLVELDQK